MRQARHARVGSFVLAITALVAACSRDTSLIQGLGGPCPSYSGGSASPATLAGTYTIVSYCQGSLPPSHPGGSLTLTARPDSFSGWIDRGRLSPVVMAGPYTVSGDSIRVSSQPGSLRSFVGTYAFSANTLYVSGNAADGRLIVAIVATK
jgi:hypothetical protein